MSRLHPVTRRVVVGLLLLSTVPFVKAQDEKPIEPLAPSLNRPIDFHRDVLPLFRKNCIACHNATTSENDLILESAEQTVKGGSEGQGVVPGKPEESLVYQFAARGAEPAMPPLPNDVKAKAFSAAELGLLRQWIIEGAKASMATGSAIAWKPINSRLKAVYSLAYDEGSGTLAASRADTVELYDVHSKRSMGLLTDPALVGLPQRAHRDVVQSLAFHPNGALLASGGYRTVKLWTRDTKPLATLQTDQPIRLFAACEDGRVAVASSDNTVRVYKDLGDPQPLVCQGHQHQLTAMALGTRSLTTADAQGDVRVWDVLTGEVLFSRKLDGKPSCVARTEDTIVVGTSEGRLLLIDARNANAPVEDIEAHKGAVTAFSLVPESTQLLSAGEDGVLHQWNVAQKKKTRSMSADAAIVAVSTSPNRERVAALGANGKTFVWSLTDGKLICTCLQDHDHSRRLAHLQRELQIAERRINYRVGKVNAAKAEVGTQEASSKAAKATREKAKAAEAEAAEKKMAEDAKVEIARKAATAKPDDQAAQAELAGLLTNQTRLTEAHDKAVKLTAAAEKDAVIISSSLARAKKTLGTEEAREAVERNRKTEVAALLQATTSKSVTVAAGIAVQWDTDACLISQHADGTRRSWDATNGRPLAVRRTDPAPIRAELSGSQSLVQIDTMTLARTQTIWSLTDTLGGKDLVISGRVLALDFSPDGAKLAVGSGKPSRSGQLQVWDVASRSLEREIADAHSDTVLDVRFSPDGKSLLSCSSDKFAKVWDLANGSHVRSFEGHTHHVLAADWQPDMTRIATAGGDNTLKVWDVETGEQKRTITTHRKQVTGLRFVGTAETVLSCSGDRTVRTFNAANGKNLRTLSGSVDYIHSLARSQDESIVVSGAENGVVRVWSGRDGKLLAKFDASPRP